MNNVLEKLEPHEKPPRESILRMRWVLEYRLDENEKKTPKTRIVIFNYLDPDYENRPAASPIMTRKPDSFFCNLVHGWDSLQPRETSVELSCKVAIFNEISGYYQYLNWRQH